MLTTLLESKSRRVRDNRGTVASVTLHALIIFAAVFATAAGAPTHDAPDLQRLRYIRIPPAPETPQRSSPKGICYCFKPRIVAPMSIDIPITIPSIEIPVASASTEFSRSTSSVMRPSDSPGDAPSGGRRAYDISEVESGVTVIGNVVPEYPGALRSSGIEGRVVAEFVVTENGRVDVASLRILSSTNDAFVESIRRALSRMRFRPAMIGDHPVAQLVQQQFVFRLN